MLSAHQSCDLLVIGAGINGAGIARDAAGRGLRVVLAEQGDIASATSQWSTKLVHGGLRYLEHFEFRLVCESLSEREVMLRAAPHLVQPLSFVLPHEPHLRPAWMIRAGLLLYDHLGPRMTLPASFGVDLARTAWGAGLKSRFTKGFVYSDARVDDARLVIANVIAAREAGAEVHVGTRVNGARRENGGWVAELADAAGRRHRVAARAIVNAAGPWVKRMRDAMVPAPARENVRHVKGSHIVVPRVHREPHAWILQNADKRIVFVIPYQDDFSLIGTTDIAITEFEQPQISEDEITYLLDIANAYLARSLSRSDVVWTFSGVRPLYDDGASDPSAITRDYVFKLDVDEASPQSAPLLSIYGGKLTTYRRLAEQALAELRPFFPAMKPAWTETARLPGGDLPGDLAAWIRELAQRFAFLPPDTVRGIARRHGTRALALLDGVRTASDLGTHFGAGLTAREIDWLIREEWARAGADVLWRRTKAGLAMTPAQRNAAIAYVERTAAHEVTSRELTP